jgi:hypothetical protein
MTAGEGSIGHIAGIGAEIVPFRGHNWQRHAERDPSCTGKPRKPWFPMSTINWSSVGLPVELVNEITAISRAEDRTKHAVIRRAIRLYRQQAERVAAVENADNEEALAQI